MSEAYRRFPRIASNHSVLVTKLDDGAEEFGITKTMALGGCSVISSEPFGVGRSVELLIAINREEVIKALGRVVYERQLDDGYTEVGVEFVHLNDEHARLIEGLFESRHAPPPQLPLA